MASSDAGLVRRARPHGRRRAPAIGLAVVLLLVAAAAGCGGDGGGAGAQPAAPPGPRVPARVATGCGSQAATAPDDLRADRAVARCSPGHPAPAPLPRRTTVRVATPPAVPELAPLLLADALGEFAAENLDVELVELGTRDAHAALAVGDVDVVVGRIDGPYFDAVHDGSGARLVLGGTLAPDPDDRAVSQTGLWVSDEAVEDGGLTALQLQPVALPGGIRSVATYPVGRRLGQTEITLNDVAVVDQGGPDAAQALLDGELAAAWLDGGAWLPVSLAEGFHLAVTLPPSESLDGTVMSARLLGPDRDVGVAYARAVIRTINTHLTGDYRSDGPVRDALAAALGGDVALVRDLPALLFDWELRDGTPSRVEEQLRQLGGVKYDIPLPAADLVDHTIAGEAVSAPVGESGAGGP